MSRVSRKQMGKGKGESRTLGRVEDFSADLAFTLLAVESVLLSVSEGESASDLRLTPR
jgi:hypothetical protein